MNTPTSSNTNTSEKESCKSNVKISLILIAYHHNSGNIASQRFHGLLKYLPTEKFIVHVFSGPSHSDDLSQTDDKVIEIDEPLLAQASSTARFSVLSCMIKTRPRKAVLIRDDSWIAQVVNQGKLLVRAELEAGRHVIVMATYSPIDALIAGRLIAEAENVPLIQDFRDGLVHENLGRKGWAFKFLRTYVEAWAVHSASMITTVSRPLVSYFKRQYTNTPIALLYNGFDSALLKKSNQRNQEFKVVQKLKPVIGHFGRVSASEAARFKTLYLFLQRLKAEPFSGSLKFYGVLTQPEVDLLANSGLHHEIYGQVNREEALASMAMMSALLIVTGNSESVATGKIFEYLFSGRRIILATQCRNEAVRILEEIGDDDIIIDFANILNLPSASEFERLLQKPFKRNFDRIARFEKSAQAQEFANILESAHK